MVHATARNVLQSIGLCDRVDATCICGDRRYVLLGCGSCEMASVSSLTRMKEIHTVPGVVSFSLPSPADGVDPGPGDVELEVALD